MANRKEKKILGQTKVYDKAIKNWPEDERPREKLFKSGEHTLSNAELLAILLRSGVKGQMNKADPIIREIFRSALYVPAPPGKLELA